MPVENSVCVFDTFRLLLVLALLLLLLALLLMLLLSFCLATILSPKAPLVKPLLREGLLVVVDAGAFADDGVAVLGAAGVAGVVVAVAASSVAAEAAFGLRNEVLVPRGALMFFIRPNFFSWETCATLWETRFKMAMLECTNWRSPPPPPSAAVVSFFLNPVMSKKPVS